MPFPDEQVLSTDITANAANTEFTINTPGVYSLGYHVACGSISSLRCAIQINGVEHPLSVYRSVGGGRFSSANIVADLTTGDVVRVALTSTKAGTLRILPYRGGATLTMINLSETSPVV